MSPEDICRATLAIRIYERDQRQKTPRRPGRPRVRALPSPEEVARRDERKRQREANAASRPRFPRAARKNRQLLNAYGVDLQQWDALGAAQQHRCAVCRCAFGGSPGNRAEVDHNHITGKIRGLLCGRCNVALGDLGDDEARLAAFARYLGFRLVRL